MPPKKKQIDPEKRAQILADAKRDRDLRQQGYRERAFALFPHICGRCGREFSGQRLPDVTAPHHPASAFPNKHAQCVTLGPAKCFPRCAARGRAVAEFLLSRAEGLRMTVLGQGPYQQNIGLPGLETAASTAGFPHAPPNFFRA